MTTKTVHSRFNHEVGEKVEGCTIIEKRIVAPPNPVEGRRGIYDYIVEVPPAVAHSPASRKTASAAAPAKESFTRSTPDEMGGGVIRRFSGR
jgi:hypothetical protein